MRRVGGWLQDIIIVLLVMVCICPCVSNAEMVKYDYHLLTANYMNEHFIGMAEDFSSERGILEEARTLMIAANLIKETDYEEGVVPAKELESFCKQNDIPWEGLITIPILYDLFEATDETVVHYGNTDIINVNDWTRATRHDGSFFIGGMDSNQNMVNGLYFYADEGALYWGSFEGNKREGTGVMLYPNNDCYYGSWHEDQMNGYGIYYFGGQLSGEYYGGYWKNSMMNGEGTYVNAVQVIKAIWENNIPIEKLQ